MERAKSVKETSVNTAVFGLPLNYISSLIFKVCFHPQSVTSNPVTFKSSSQLNTGLRCPQGQVTKPNILSFNFLL